MIKTILKILLVSITIFVLVACSAFQPDQRARQPLRVEFTQWWGDYTLIIAQENGLFEKYGVQVEPVYYEVFSDAFPDLAAGQIDGALISVGDAISINRSNPVKVVAIYDNGGEDAVLVSSEINSVQELRGKAIGFQPGSPYELTVAEMLRSANMDYGDVTVIEMNPEDALAALQSNRVQAAYTWEPYLSDALANGYKTIYPQEQLYLYPDMIVFNKSIVEQRPDEIRAFLKAWFEAVDYRQKNPELTRSIIADFLGKSIEEVQSDDNLKILTLEDNKALFDIQSDKSIYSVTKRTSDYLISIGAVTQSIDPLELLDPTYLP